MTSRLTFSESIRQMRHFDLQFTLFLKNSKFDLFWDFWPRVTFYDLATSFLKNWRQERHFDIQFTPFPWNSKFDPKWPKIWNLTPNKIFFPQKNSYVLLIILSYCSWNLVRSTIFNKKNKSKPEIVRENRKLEILKINCRSVWPLKDVLSDEPTLRFLKNLLRE